MKKENCQLLGVISKTHGTQGGVILKSKDNIPDEITQMERVFVEFDNILVPFFLYPETTTFRDNKTVFLHFDDCNDPDQAAELLNTKVYIPATARKTINKNYDLSQLNGYKVVDEKHGTIGKITEVLENPGNTLFSIHGKYGEVLFPVHENFIREVDIELQVLYVSFPPGLIDLNK